MRAGFHSIVLKSLPAVSLGLLVMGLVSCQEDPPPGKTEFVLFDLSASTANADVRGRYFEDYGKLMDKIEGGDTLVVDRITDNPLAQSTFPVNEVFPRMNSWTDNPLQFKHKKKLQRERIDKVVKEMVDDLSQRYQNTSVIDALHLAQRVFATYPDGRHVLVLFSDMIEESPYYDFSKESLTERRINKIIENEKKEGRLPDLNGVEVWVVGAVAGYYGRRMDPAKVRQVQNFWLAYFEAAGADLPIERYGSGLIEPPA